MLNLLTSLWFMWFLLQGLSVTEMSRRAPKLKPTQTWLKSYPCTARTVTCPSKGGATIFQVKALTSWSLITPTHYGEIKLFTTGFITVPEMPIYCFWMYTLQKNTTLKNYFWFHAWKKMKVIISKVKYRHFYFLSLSACVEYIWSDSFERNVCSNVLLIDIWRSFAYVPRSHICTVLFSQV